VKRPSRAADVCTRANLLRCMDKMMTKREIADHLGVSDDFLRKAMRDEGLFYTAKQGQEIRRRVMLQVAGRGKVKRAKALKPGTFGHEVLEKNKIIAASHELAVRCLKLMIATHPDNPERRAS
jgi:hypothetical protein